MFLEVVEEMKQLEKRGNVGADNANDFVADHTMTSALEHYCYYPCHDSYSAVVMCT